MSDVTTELAKEASDKAMQIARLKAENAKLRNDADLLRAMLSQVQTEKRCYMAENAKLRECLQDLAEHIREDDGFGLDYGWMLDRMRELGVVE